MTRLHLKTVTVPARPSHFLFNIVVSRWSVHGAEHNISGLPVGAHQCVNRAGAPPKVRNYGEWRAGIRTRTGLPVLFSAS
jgi:hypothetical protein